MSESIWINDLLTHAGNLNICETFKTFQTHLRIYSKDESQLKIHFFEY